MDNSRSRNQVVRREKNDKCLILASDDLCYVMTYEDSYEIVGRGILCCTCIARLYDSLPFDNGKMPNVVSVVNV